MTALTQDAFLGGRLSIWQPKEGFRGSMDAVLMAAAVPALPGDRVLELGCGAGTALLCLGCRVQGLALTGLELQAFYAGLARRNAEEAGIPVRVVEGDLSRMPSVLRSESFDHVMANPPFFPRGRATAPREAGRMAAHIEETPLHVWIAAGLKRLETGGRFTMIHRAERLGHILGAFETGRAGDIGILPLAPREGRPANRVIVSARKGRRGPLRLLPPVVMHDGPSRLGDGDDSSAIARAVLREGAALPL